MADTARVVVIGGGVTGCSVAWHLVQKGWRDVILCERTELTAGSTWHSAGHVILYTLEPTISRLNRYSVELYGRLQAETGQDPGFHACGNLRLATHPGRLAEMERYLEVARATGVAARMLNPAEIAEIHPLMRTEGILGGVLNPDDGYIAPADLTQAFAAGARAGGAEIRRNCPVTGLERDANGKWRVETGRGLILADHVVSATGNYTAQTMAMVGLPGHSVPVKHEYIVTEPLQVLAERRRAGLPELPVFRDPEQSFYVRQEGDGLAMGAYEDKGETVFVDGVPDSFGMDLFPDDLDRLLPFLERAMERLPILSEAGIRSVINGPMPYTPDDLPLTGPAPGLDNFWLAEGNPFGITLAGGVGWQLAEWITTGEPGIDMRALDPRRYGQWASRAWCALRTEEAYEHTYRIPAPDQQSPVGRMMRTGPLHDLLEARGAVFEDHAGWERVRHFAVTSPDGDAVEHEMQALRESAGLADLCALGRMRLCGAGAADMLSSLLETPLPAVGACAWMRSNSPRGTTSECFLIWREAESRFLVTCDAPAEGRLFDMLEKAARRAGGVAAENLTGRMSGLALAGPEAARILNAVEDTPGSPGLPQPGQGREGSVALVPVILLHLPDGGGYEMHAGSETLRRVFHALVAQGADRALRLVGARALEGA